MTRTSFLIRLFWTLLLVALAAGIVWLAGRIAERGAIDRLSAETRGAAMLRQSYLKSEIERFRLLPVALSDDSDLVAAMTGDRKSVV